ncbi:Protein-tyrosine phosphatase [Ancylostoma duodenale]|uniref:Protein-tyrosine phosphatase n=1 Tax=Ancylostoma duodenale TaxID=51022 RepID=A0A0C2GVZ6_9BILA|nr:Protein-tyrosine phosphatase [Ancylostoma duodenale]
MGEKLPINRPGNAYVANLLPAGACPNNDYIHASKIMVGNNVFICTQGPLENTVESFWAMIFQEKVKLIVMLCRFIEEGKEKCYEYFPKNEGKLVFGDFVIESSYRMPIPDGDGATSAMLEVTHKGKKEKVEHIWYENWADHAAPENFRATFDLIQMARSWTNWMFVAIELAAHMAATKSNFKMETVLREIRDQRMHSIQNDVQYLYVYRGFVEYLIRKGVTRRMDVLKFITDYDNLIKRKKTREQEKDMSAFAAPGRSKDYCPSVYYNPYNFY